MFSVEGEREREREELKVKLQFGVWKVEQSAIFFNILPKWTDEYKINVIDHRKVKERKQHIFKSHEIIIEYP